MTDPITKSLVDLAEEFNGIIGTTTVEAETYPGEPERAPCGYFVVVPDVYIGGGIVFKASGPCWDNEIERPSQDPDDDDSEPIPVRDYLLAEMETLGRRVLEFVAAARGEAVVDMVKGAEEEGVPATCCECTAVGAWGIGKVRELKYKCKDTPGGPVALSSEAAVDGPPPSWCPLRGATP